MPPPGLARKLASLGEIAAAVADAAVVGDPCLGVTGLYQDSRALLPGAIFAVRRGEKTDGRAFVESAKARGAAALLTDDPELARSSALPAIVVPDARAAIGPAAQVAYGSPFERIEAVGVTGTNGKTTTSFLIGALLAALGARPAVLGTLGCHFGELSLPSAHTTPEADDIARVAADLIERGASHLVMEVSSHALSLDRVAALRFRAAAFTNLSHDHLDFHGTMEAYFEAKARLFLELSPERSVVNVDDGAGRELAQRLGERAYRVSAAGREPAELRVTGVSLGADGVRGELVARGHARSLASPLIGAHNLENLAVALGVIDGLGFDLGEAVVAASRAPTVPGRLERCSEAGSDLLVVVDYAHTPDALARVLAALRPLGRGKLACVFGCGGDRDRAKRGPMGVAAARGADRLTITSDNPRSEPPALIAAAILEGVRAAGSAAEIVLDRAAAIERAVLSASPGDTVLIAGKGHEPYQITGGVTRPFDDRVEARRALALRRAR